MQAYVVFACSVEAAATLLLSDVIVSLPSLCLSCSAVLFVREQQQLQELLSVGSICKMKQNMHFMVPEADFHLLKGEDKLTLYQVCA